MRRGPGERTFCIARYAIAPTAGTLTALALSAVALTACGSRGPLFDDPFRGRDAALSYDAASPHDAVDIADTALPCDWEEVADGLTGAGISALEEDTREGRHVFYAASSASLYRSTDAGRTFERRGAVPASIRAVAFPDAATDILLGTSDGVWVSHDEGATFEPLSLRGLQVSELEVHAAGRDRVFASVLSLGLLRSNDEGRTWAPAAGGLEPAASVTHVTTDPRNLSVAVAGTISNDPVFFGATNEGQLVRTTNDGTGWSTVDDAGGRVFDLRRCPANPDVIYAARYYGLYRSTDGGATFSPVAPLAGPVGMVPSTTPTSVAVQGDLCEHVVVLMATPSLGAFVSDDGGATFAGPFLDGLGLSRLSQSLPTIRATGGRAVVVASSSGIYRSDDGATYEVLANLTEVGVGTLAQTEGHVWASTGGAGVWVLDRGGTRWDRIATADLENEASFSVLPIAGATAAAGDVLVGAYGFVYGRFGSGSFARVPTDGIDADNVFDFVVLDDGTVVSASQTEGIQRSDDGGRTFRFSRDGIDGWMTPLGVATDLRTLTAGPAGSGVVVAGSAGRGIWHSEDRALHWTRAGLGDVNITSVRYSPVHDSYIASVEGGGAATSRDGRTWSTRNAGLDSLDVGGIAVDGDRVFLVAGGSIYETRSLPDARWSRLEGACAPSRMRSPLAVTRPDGHWLFVAAGSHGAYRYPLD